MFQAIFDIITIGFPFCVFKITTGVYYNQKWLIALGLIDLGINAINLICWLLKKRAFTATCLFAFIFHKFVNAAFFDFGESLDVMFSFIIVAWIIGSGTIVHYPAVLVIPWNIAVVLNVLGAGANRVFNSVGGLRS